MSGSDRYGDDYEEYLEEMQAIEAWETEKEQTFEINLHEVEVLAEPDNPVEGILALIDMDESQLEAHFYSKKDNELEEEINSGWVEVSAQEEVIKSCREGKYDDKEEVGKKENMEAVLEKMQGLLERRQELMQKPLKYISQLNQQQLISSDLSMAYERYWANMGI